MPGCLHSVPLTPPLSTAAQIWATDIGAYLDGYNQCRPEPYLPARRTLFGAIDHDAEDSTLGDRPRHW